MLVSRAAAKKNMNESKGSSKKVNTHIFAKAFIPRLAGAVASQELHPLCRAQRRGKGKVASLDEMLCIIRGIGQR